MIHRLLTAVLLCIALASPAVAQTTKPITLITRAMIISIDGLRPDVLLRSDAPRTRALMARGSFTCWARSTSASITLPTHVSMLTGCIPEVHAIMWNGDLPLSKPVYPRVPTIFELAKHAGLSTAMVTGKSKFKIMDKPGTIDFSYFPDEAKSDDADVAEHADQILRSNRPQVMFIHFPGADNVGHAKGWGTPEQLAAVAAIDTRVGKIVDTLAELKLDESTLLIVTADHGGAGRTHGSEDFRSRHIPWIAVGPGIRAGYDLTMNRELIVDVYDTFSTVAAMLAIPVPNKVNGKFIEDILEHRSLIK